MCIFLRLLEPQALLNTTLDHAFNCSVPCLLLWSPLKIASFSKALSTCPSCPPWTCFPSKFTLNTCYLYFLKSTIVPEQCRWKYPYRKLCWVYENKISVFCCDFKHFLLGHVFRHVFIPKLCLSCPSFPPSLPFLPSFLFPFQFYQIKSTTKIRLLDLKMYSMILQLLECAVSLSFLHTSFQWRRRNLGRSREADFEILVKSHSNVKYFTWVIVHLVDYLQLV